MDKETKGDEGILSRRGFLKMTGLFGGAAVLGSLGTEPSLAAEAYPSRKLTWLVGTQPGGGNDILTRGVAPYVQKYLKMASSSPNRVGVVVKNMPGSSGMKAINFIHEAKPDGYNIDCDGDAIHTQAVLDTLGFGLFELSYLCRIASTRKILVTNSDSKIDSWETLVQLSKKNQIKIGISGFGGSNHIASLFLIDTTKLNAKTVIFEGSSGLSAAMIRQDVPVGMYSEDSVKNLIDAQALRPLLTFSETSPWKQAQNVKTIGFPELNDVVGGQRYIIAPPRLPQNVKKTLVNALQQGFADKDFLAWKNRLQIDISPIFGEELDRVVKNNNKFYMSKQKLMKECLL
jgi:tripartite-type tricarboxylate transporter receptor subunit TctC